MSYSSSAWYRATPRVPVETVENEADGEAYAGVAVGGHGAEDVRFLMREATPTAMVLTCQGGLSWEERDVLAHHIGEYLQQRPTVTALVADMTAVEYVNSAGLGALFQLNRRLRDRGGRLVFANVPPQLLRVFRAVGLDRLTGIEQNVEAALDQLEGPADHMPAEDYAPNSPPPM